MAWMVLLNKKFYFVCKVLYTAIIRGFYENILICLQKEKGQENKFDPVLSNSHFINSHLSILLIYVSYRKMANFTLLRITITAFWKQNIYVLIHVLSCFIHVLFFIRYFLHSKKFLGFYLHSGFHPLLVKEIKSTIWNIVFITLDFSGLIPQY